MFHDDAINEWGVYCINIVKNGMKTQVIVDDHFVCQNQPVFTRANGNELWVLLVEKAWAKIHGSFDRIQWGWAHLTMRDLTGAPGYDYMIDSKPDLAECMLEWDLKNYTMAIGLNDKKLSKEALRELGLIFAHSYGIIACKEVNDGGNTVTLVQIRNPWGKTEWNGDWGDKSNKWTDELKDELGWTDEDDGAFWMDYADVKRLFSHVSVCLYEPDYVFSNLQISAPYACLNVTV